MNAWIVARRRKGISFSYKKTEMRLKWKKTGFLPLVYDAGCTFLLVCESRTEPTCELQGQLLRDGVEGTEESGNSETSAFPSKNSNSWIFAKEGNE